MRRDLSFWDVMTQEWIISTGDFTLSLGFSSRDFKFDDILDGNLIRFLALRVRKGGTDGTLFYGILAIEIINDYDNENKVILISLALAVL